MFGGLERVVNAPVRAGDNHEATIRITCQKELEIYMSTPGIPLRKENKKFSDPLAWWMAVGENGKFPILAQSAKHFLAIPATSAPSERIWSRSAGVATAKRSRLDASVTSGTMFVKENEEILRKHYKRVVSGASGSLSAPLYLPVDVEKSKEEVDVGQDLFDLKF